MASDGWFKVFRKVFDCPAFEGERFSKREAWIYIVSRANHSPKDVRGMHIDRGQFHDSIEKLAMTWKWDRKSVMRFLDFLESENMIVIEKSRYGTSKGTMITVVNYEVYQGSMDINEDIKRDIKEDIKRDIKRDINKNIKNDKNVKKENNNTSTEADEILADFEKIYSIYPQKKGKAIALRSYRQWVTVGRDDGSGRKRKLTNKQIWKAVRLYCDENEDTEKQYWKHFSTLMNNITDYVREEEQ